MGDIFYFLNDCVKKVNTIPVTENSVYLLEKENVEKIKKKFVQKANAETNVRSGYSKNKVYLLTTNRASFIQNVRTKLTTTKAALYFLK